ncbi:MAG: DUF6894 family protein [Bauldia sp.]|jgi:hypothetical protein
MPVFHFHLTDDGRRSPDLDGSDFASLELAYLAAFRAVQDMAWEMVHRGRDPRRCSFEIADHAGIALVQLPFAEVLDQTRDPIFQIDAAAHRPCAEGRAGEPNAGSAPAVDTRRSAALPPMLRLDEGRSIHFDVGEPLAD